MTLKEIKSIATFIGVIIGWIFAALLRARTKITSHFLIPASGHLRPIFPLKILKITRYSCGFAHSDRPNLTQIWARNLRVIFARTLRVTEYPIDQARSFFSVPEVFAWGQPTFDPGISITCVIAALLLLSMVFASVNGTADAVDGAVSEKRMNNAVGVHGAAIILTGLFSTIGFMPYVSSAGIVRMTGVAARKPFYWAAAGMMFLGLITPLAAFFATIPKPVGYAALIMIFAPIMGQGLREFKALEVGNRESFIIGISILTGIGVMSLPASAFSKLPQVLSYLLSNGLVDGMLTAILLEKIILKE